MLGATIVGDATEFLVWAPYADRVSVVLCGDTERTFPLEPTARGYFYRQFDEPLRNVPYFVELVTADGHKRRGDPASRFQPRGVFGPSQVVDSQFGWSDADWHGLPLEQFILYELHVGTFSKSGDFEGVVRQLDTLNKLGITAVEIMPIAQFPGRRNWGYDGVFPYAAQNSYGGPAEFQRLVNECHARGIAVVLDVVYNHLGPEGNYLHDFGPYFTDQYHTPWGQALNYDGPHSDEVHRFFIENALYWIRDCHVDALRLDAIQTIFDNSARPFLRELARAVHDEAQRLGRHAWLIGETNQNDVRQIAPIEQNGLGLDAVWNDDFHHSLHALLTGERVWVFQDYGSTDDLAKAYREGFVLTGQYANYYERSHGSSSEQAPGKACVIFAQNHDQTGGRLYGERLSTLVSYEELKLTAGLLLLAPYVPMLFMGEEYGETTPFPYFVDHGDEDLLERVRNGRMTEFQHFVREDTIVPDPASPATFELSRLDFGLMEQQKHRALWDFHQCLINLRKSVPALANLDKTKQDVTRDDGPSVIASHRVGDGHETLAVFHFGKDPATWSSELLHGQWDKLLDSADSRWCGPGTTIPDRITSKEAAHIELQPLSVCVFRRAGSAGQ